ncbi:ATP cone domain-containing protein [Methanoculleus sp. MH98A]|uniref:ATP cone domain-containing protein n=1 Tax=Methanoculleus sp. MH98A TaxID=1495314 RepID=UPI000693C125|nr:ATP cone domain-containing protein [Methanoculleus sp. MH98A]
MPSVFLEVIELVDVVKADGRREPFVREKVTVSALKSGAPPEEARAIGEAVERIAYDGMPSGEIRRRVLEQLHDRNPEWEENWRIYDRAVKKRGAAAVELPAR